MKEEFPDWFGSQIRQRHVDNDKDPKVSTTSELFALACGPTWTPISINSCVVDGVRYVVDSHDELVLFRVKWFDTQNQGRKVKRLVLRNNMTQTDTRGEAFKNDQYILVTQVKQVFYLEDKAKPHWKVVKHVNHKKFSDGDVIVVEDDPDIIHFDNSSDLPLFTSLNDLDNATLHIDGQSMEVDASPDIIDVVNEDDDIIDDEDALPHDLADFDDEDLINVDDDGVDKMSADVARSHGGDGGGKDRPPPHYVPSGCGGCFANRGKGKRKPNLGGRAGGRLNTRDNTQNLSLKEIIYTKGPVLIQFEVRDKQTLMPLGEHAAHWSSYIEERQSSTTQEYPSLIDTFFVAHTVNGEFLRDEDRRIYEEMRRLEATDTYTDDEINRLARGGKQRGHIPGVGRVLPARATASPNMFSQFESGGASGSGGNGDDEESADDQDDEDEDGDVSLRIVVGEGIPVGHSPRRFPSDKSLRKPFPTTSRLGKPRNVVGECGGSHVLYDKENVSRYGILNKYDSDGLGIKWVEVPDCFCFHLWNAWEESETGELVVIGSCMTPADSILTNVSGFAKVDLSTGEMRKFTYGDSKYGGQPMFLPSSKRKEDEDSGSILVFDHDEKTWESELQIVNATTLELEATVKLPTRVPYGFHGTFVTAKHLATQA
nr:hypothetical protein [Tanacetum cinerariifolium]